MNVVSYCGCSHGVCFDDRDPPTLSYGRDKNDVGFLQKLELLCVTHSSKEHDPFLLLTGQLGSHVAVSQNPEFSVRNLLSYEFECGYRVIWTLRPYQSSNKDQYRS